MPVKLTSGGKLLFSLTSPPPKPEPAPDQKLIAQVVSYPDREIIVTVPFPDSLELVAEVVNDLLEVPDLSGKPAKATYQELDEDIKTSLIEIAMGLPAFVTAKVNPKNPTWAKFFIEYDEVQPLNRARLSLRREQGVDFGVWKLRLESSPFKAGPKGLVKLTAGLASALPFLNLPKLIDAFSIPSASPWK